MLRGRYGLAGRAAGWMLVGAVALAPATGRAADPRWTAGRTYFSSPNGQPVLWNTPQLQYYTDPGDLSAAVSHAAADQMVAAAAAMWNVSISSVVLGQGGTLSEHVSGSNMYLGASGPVFPSDVQVSNGSAKPIAVIYDTDGSVTDTLLGGGASDPGNCRQNAVTESVDGISPAAQITHAVLVLNGRCTGAAAELQLEMQYKLGRAFGRVLGFGWSQANDNVWTGNPVATYQQALHWPLMHPVDILCGPYAYQCVVQPFTLKTDDLATIASLYPVTTPGNGKTATYAEATYIVGSVDFANGQGMQGVNVVSRTRHQQSNATDTWDGTSSVTGYQFQRVGGNPVVAKGTSVGESFGSPTADSGYYRLGWMPSPAADFWDDITVYTQAINPLYTGQYAVGPYQSAQVTPSGPQLSAEANFIGPFNWWNLSMSATNGAGPCSTATDGTEREPAAVDATGWWSSTMCGYGHTAWSSLAVKARRTLAVEVTSLDDAGLPTTGKLQPVIGLWDSTDAVGSAPTLGAQTDSLNTTTLGMTSLLYASGSTGRTLRMGLGDSRGDGRPDFGYKGRVLYADAVSPATLPPNGGQVTISGMGFRNGNAVTVGGVAASVVSWSATTIVANAPALTGTGAMDVTVTDVSTGSQTTMTGALAYGGAGQVDGVSVVSSPASGGYVGVAGAPDFKVQVTLPGGTGPAVGESVTVAATQAVLGACGGAASCVLTSDGQGQVTTTVTPVQAGTVTLSATLSGTAGGASATAAFTTGNAGADVLRVTSAPGGTVYAGVAATNPFAVQVLLADGVTAAAGAQVTVAAVNATLGACGGASCTMTADGAGMVSTAVTPVGAGRVSLVATASGGTAAASFGAVALPADGLRVMTVPADGSYAGRAAGTPFSVRVMLGDWVTPAAGAAVGLTVMGGTLAACGAASCTVVADGSGTVSTAVTPLAPGVVMLAASAAGGATAQAAFTAAAAPQDSVRAVTVPADGSYVGRVAGVAFLVQAANGETGAVAAGSRITLTTSNGTLGACGSVACVLTADANGRVSTSVTPGFAGPVTLTGAEGGGQVTVTFMAVALPPDVVRVVSVPADGSVVGVAAAPAFGVQVLAGDTGGPAAGVTVVLAGSNGTTGCGMWNCPVQTDANGMASAQVTPTSPGIVGLTATEGGGSATASFTAVAGVADALRTVSAPVDGASPGQAAATRWMVEVTRGPRGSVVGGVVVVMTATNATMTNCGGLTTCWLTTDGNGHVWTPVTPTGPGLVVLTATEGGGTVTTRFLAVSSAGDRLRVRSQPTGSVYAGVAAANPFRVQVTLADGATPAAGVPVTVGAVNARLAGCGGAVTCVLTADGSGNVSTGVTPVGAGLVTLTASAGGGTAAASFGALGLPVDGLRVVSAPADGSYVGVAAGVPLQVQVMLGDGVTPAAGVAVTLSSAGANFGSCTQVPCVLTADGGGTVSTTVVPSVVGSVTLTASAGGGMVSARFRAGIQGPDALSVVSAPADGAYVGEVAGNPFRVRVVLADGVTLGAGEAVTLSAAGGSLGACGAASCVVTADSGGLASTSVMATAAGTVTLTASAGGGRASAAFTASVRPPDGVRVVSAPADGAWVGQAAGRPFAVQVMLGDGVTVGAGVAVTLSASGASLGACGGAGCVVTADGTGMVSTSVTPTAAGAVALSAAAGGGRASATFAARVMPPDGVRVVSAPADGAWVGQAASRPFAVQVMLGDGVTVGAGVAVTLSASGASLGACGGAGCVVTADGSGMVSTSVTPTAAGAVRVTASAGGGAASVSFQAVPVPPDGLQVISAPGNGAEVGLAAVAPLTIQVMQPDGVTAAAGAIVTVTAAGAVLGACGGTVCALTADGQGQVSTTVMPQAAGTVTVSAAAGGGTVSATFTAVGQPDVLRVLSAPAGTAYVGYGAGTRFVVQVMLPDGVTQAAGAAVSLAGASFAACGAGPCVLTADALGMVSTEVTPTVAGAVTLTATSGGGSVVAMFTAVDAVRGVTLARVTEYVAPGAMVPWTPAGWVFENAAPAVGAAVQWTGDAASGIVFAVATTATDGQGGTGNQGMIGPLAAGLTATGAACAWTTVCAPLNAVAVDPTHWRMVAVSGDGQDIAVASTLQPVGVRVVDDQGHWIAGATVSLRQVVDGWVDCPTVGRCPIPPVLGESAGTLTSDVDGMVSGVPLEVPGVRETTRMVFAAGPNGYVALSLAKSH